MTLCTVALEMPTSWDSCLVDFGDCWRCSLTAWTLAGVLTVTCHPLWSLLSFPTLALFLNFSTMFIIVFLHGTFLPGNSLQNALCVRTTDWKLTFRNICPFVHWKLMYHSPFWYQTNSTGLVNSSPENEKKVFIFLENISKEKWVDFCGPPCKYPSNHLTENYHMSYPMQSSWLELNCC